MVLERGIGVFRVTRVYIVGIEKQLNQMLASVAQLRDEASRVRAASAGGNSEPNQFKAADALDFRICEIRRILSEFKQTEDFKRKKGLQEDIEKRLDEFKDVICAGNKRE